MCSKRHCLYTAELQSQVIFVNSCNNTGNMYTREAQLLNSMDSSAASRAVLPEIWPAVSQRLVAARTDPQRSSGCSSALA